MNGGQGTQKLPEVGRTSKQAEALVIVGERAVIQLVSSSCILEIQGVNFKTFTLAHCWISDVCLKTKMFALFCINSQLLSMY